MSGIHPIQSFNNLPKGKKRAIIATSAAAVGATALTAVAMAKGKALTSSNIFERIGNGYKIMAINSVINAEAVAGFLKGAGATVIEKATKAGKTVFEKSKTALNFVSDKAVKAGKFVSDKAVKLAHSVADFAKEGWSKISSKFHK